MEKEKAKQAKEAKKKTKKSRLLHRDYGEPIEPAPPIFVDLKSVPEEELEEAVISDFGSCPSYVYFDSERDEF
jgi:hypothetical protein